MDSDDFVTRKLDDMLETVEGYTFYNPDTFRPQCPICWDVLTLKFKHGENKNPMGDYVRIFKCKKHGDDDVETITN